MVAKIILVGVAGFGSRHLANILRLQDTGQVKLTALVDPIVAAQVRAGTGTVTPSTDASLFDKLSQALEAVGVPEVVVISVPIHLHAVIATEALRAGADVLLEKPPFARMADFQALLGVEKETGRVVQVGFQSLGSKALDALRSEAIDIGRIRAVRAMGCWLRRKAYWGRSQWVGRRNIGDVDVVDGVATNALAHAVVTALCIAGVQEAEEVRSVEVEMYRANPIDADDTTSIRVTPVNGPIITAALTLCASEQTQPVVEVVGDRGVADFGYVSDDVAYKTTDESWRKHYDRVDLLENLLAYRRDGTPLRVPLRSTGAFMRVVETIRTAGDPVHIERKWVEQRDTGSDMHPVVQEVEKWVRAATSADGLFSEVGAPWAFTGRDVSLARAEVDGQTVFEVLDGVGTAPSSSPRPYIHPVRTLGGVEVTATRPADHDWHLGIGFAIPDVDGTSFWGGGTFVRDRGYVLLDDHGRMTTERIENIGATKGIGGAMKGEAAPPGFDHTIAWHDRAGRVVIHDVRQLRWSPLREKKSTADQKLPAGWILSFRSSLTAIDGPVSLGSPGTNGRVNAGYGGFFWRLPRCSDVVIMSAVAEGENAVHGSVSSWIAWSARFEARPGGCGDATLVLVPNDPVSAADRWVVRLTAYPGIGSAIAWEERVGIPDTETISRGFRIAVLDGRLERAEMAAVAGELRGEA